MACFRPTDGETNAALRWQESIPGGELHRRGDSGGAAEGGAAGGLCTEGGRAARKDLYQHRWHGASVGPSSSRGETRSPALLLPSRVFVGCRVVISSKRYWHIGCKLLAPLPVLVGRSRQRGISSRSAGIPPGAYLPAAANALPAGGGGRRAGGGTQEPRPQHRSAP